MRLSSPLRSRSFAPLLACVALASGAGCLDPIYVTPPQRVVVVERSAPVAVEEDDEEEAQPASVDVFYDRLSPYGEWVDVAPYGRVFRPAVEADFVPYGSHGHWVSTDAGWAFESNAEWSWAAYHYGRWVHDDGRGWVWLPDTVWGPSWVDWRYGDAYIGWVPMGPPGVVVVEQNWVFVESAHFTDRHVYRYAVGPERTHIAFADSVRVSEESVHGSAHWRAGPPVDHVSRVTGTQIRSVHVEAPAEGTLRVRTAAHAGGSPAQGRSVGSPAVQGRPAEVAPPAGQGRSSAAPPPVVQSRPSAAPPPVVQSRPSAAPPAMRRPTTPTKR